MSRGSGTASVARKRHFRADVSTAIRQRPVYDNAENLLSSPRHGSDELVLDHRCEGPGVQIHGHKTIDGHSSADVVLRDVRVSPDNVLLRGVKAQEAPQLALNTAIVSLCAEGLGAMETALAQTISYCKDRSQFGSPYRNSKHPAQIG